MREPKTISASPLMMGSIRPSSSSGVLSVAVKHGHAVVVFFDAAPVGDFLTAAVADVGRVAHDLKVVHVLHGLVADSHEVGVVLAVVVYDEDFLDAVDEVLRNAIEHAGQGRCRVKGRNVDRDLSMGHSRQL